MQYVVPQFIDVESKIIGPISGRQFIILAVTITVSFLLFRFLPSPVYFIPPIFLTCTIGGVLAFGKVNGQSMHYFLLNLYETLSRPRLKVWRRPTLYEVPELIIAPRLINNKNTFFHL